MVKVLAMNSNSATPPQQSQPPQPPRDRRSVPHPHQPQPHPAAPPTGTLAWALGFLSFIPIPFFNLVIAGITQTIVGMRLRKKGGVADENGRRAANWGLTLLTWFVLALLCLSPIWAMGIASGGEPVRPPTVLNVLAFSALALYVILCLVQVVYSTVGTIMAATGKVAPLPAIPYVRKKK